MPDIPQPQPFVNHKTHPMPDIPQPRMFIQKMTVDLFSGCCNY